MTKAKQRDKQLSRKFLNTLGEILVQLAKKQQKRRTRHAN